MKRWLALILLVLVTLAFVVVPVLLIQPFRPQTARSLAVGYELKRWSSWATPALALLSLVVAAIIWRNSRRSYAKVLLVLLLVPVPISVWFSRQNHFEWMFGPLVEASYVPADKVDFINDGDMVLAVEREGERVAYPVRLMAYHHLVADSVGGTPLLPTY